jgi:hypothetical protein
MSQPQPERPSNNNPGNRERKVKPQEPADNTHATFWHTVPGYLLSFPEAKDSKCWASVTCKRSPKK